MTLKPSIPNEKEYKELLALRELFAKGIAYAERFNSFEAKIEALRERDMLHGLCWLAAINNLNRAVLFVREQAGREFMARTPNNAAGIYDIEKGFEIRIKFIDHYINNYIKAKNLTLW